MWLRKLALSNRIRLQAFHRARSQRLRIIDACRMLDRRKLRFMPDCSPMKLQKLDLLGVGKLLSVSRIVITRALAACKPLVEHTITLQNMLILQQIYRCK